MDEVEYRWAYGLRIGSEFPLPELLRGGRGEDLMIRRGNVVPDSLAPTGIERYGIEALFHGGTAGACLRWPGVATLVARGGHTLTVSLESENQQPGFLNQYLLSEALGLVLHQRGLLLLHASAVRVATRAVVFVGPSGIGKSTTAAAFASAGHPVLADDMVAIALERASAPNLLPAFPHVKLWPAAVSGLRWDPASLPPVYPGATKRRLEGSQGFPTGPVRLAAIYILQEGTDVRISGIGGVEAFWQVARFFPCPNNVLRGAGLRRHFQQSVQLSRMVPIRRLERPNAFDAIPELVRKVTDVTMYDP